MRLKNKVAVVTGGAMGIGQATALRFAEEGAKVILVDIAESEGKATERIIVEKGGDCEFILGDVTKEADWERVMGTVEKRHGCLDVLFNNAGTNLVKPAIGVTMDEWDRVMNLNLKGVFLGAQNAIRMMIRGKGGSIINTASTFAFIGFYSMPVYCASKGGIMALTRQLALDYAKYNIRINCVCPGPTLTPLVEREMKLGLAKAEDILQGVPMARFAQPSEIASAVLFLASDDSSYVTGTGLVVDGGRLVY
jgi:NAD(P)-dependent dehydrogenase (short-subunit alcohol dehydrogenase family)